MPWTIFVMILVMWLLGFSLHVGGGLIHLLLVVAVVVGIGHQPGQLTASCAWRLHIPTKTTDAGSCSVLLGADFAYLECRTRRRLLNDLISRRAAWPKLSGRAQIETNQSCR